MNDIELTEQNISGYTGFDLGIKFPDADSVRDYFRVENFVDSYYFCPDNPLSDQSWLDAAAEAVIEHRWHMEETE